MVRYLGLHESTAGEWLILTVAHMKSKASPTASRLLVTTMISND